MSVEDTTDREDALAGFVEVENKKHGIEEEQQSSSEDSQTDEVSDSSETQTADGQANTDKDQEPPPEEKDPDGSDGAQDADPTREQLLERLEQSEADNKRLEHANDSNVGRVRALQRKSDTYRAELNALETSRDGPSTETAQSEIVNAEAELTEIEAELEIDYPGTLKLLKASRKVDALKNADTIRREIAPVRQSAEVMLSESVQSGAEEAADILAGKYDVTKLMKSDGFTKWVDVLPPTIRKIFDTSEDPAEQLQVIETYAVGRDVSEFLVNPPPKEVSSKSDLKPSQDDIRTQQAKDAQGIDGSDNAKPDVTRGDTSDDAESSFKAVEQDKYRRKEQKGVRRVAI